MKAFTQINGIETFETSVTDRNPSDLVVLLLGIAAVHGLERTETAIRNTFCKNESNLIITGMNTALRFTP